MTSVAHISDVHLGPLPRVWPHQLINKRLTGYLNWKLTRKTAMPFEKLAQLTDHLKAKNPDLIAVSGDLVNLALPKEFEAAKSWLQQLGSPEQVAVIPGNHDAYVRGALEKATNLWSGYMGGSTVNNTNFPFRRQKDHVALIGCSSAVVTPPFFATGTFDEEQGERLKTILKQTKSEGLYRIVMIHHPPHEEVKQIWRRGLKGRELFRQIIKSEGAELVLHGHLHKSMVHPLDGPNGEIPLIGVASAAAGNGGKHAPARYNLFDIQKAGQKFECSMTELGYQRVGDGIIKRMELNLH